MVFTCDEGSDLIGPSERECQNNGKWSGDGETRCGGKFLTFDLCTYIPPDILYAGIVMTSFYYAVIPTRGNCFQTKPTRP